MQLVMAGALIAVWGRVFYRMYKNMQVQTEVAKVQQENTVPQDEIHLFDTFKIAANYPDPFLGKKAEKKYTGPAGATVARPLVQIKPPEPAMVQWPNVVYLGILVDRESGKKMALASVNNVSKKIYAGSEIGSGVTLTKIYRDSIELKLGEQIKVVRK